jgi:hypothetical protein
MFASCGGGRVTLLRAIAFTACAWGVAFACTWVVVVTLGEAPQ